MGRDEVSAVLARADTAFELPRLGGMARPDGVVIVSERFWAFAGRDGTVREGRMLKPPAALAAIPLVRGLVRLASSLTPLFRRDGVARRRERLLLAAALAAPLVFAFLPSSVGLAAGVALSVVLLAWMLRGRTLFLHGAEHRAIAAADERRLAATWDDRARPSRFSERCGTNFAVFAVATAIAADVLWPLPTAFYTPVVVAGLALAASMELWRLVQRSSRRAVRALLVPGLALQRVTTREPHLAETQVALTAVASVLRRELA